MEVEFPVPHDPEALDALLAALPNAPAVFLLWPKPQPGGTAPKPGLFRTNVLRRRVSRLLSGAFRDSAGRLEYRLTGSRLEAQFALLAAARRHFGSARREYIRIRFPHYVRLAFTNPFPRTRLVRKPGRSDSGVTVGPFRSRSTAAAFEAACLDLFQLRRCAENLMPRPDHPGCIYGDMNRCLRPCQQAVGPEEYGAEADRVALFLRTSGQSLLDTALAARERLSENLDFEGAAFAHQRVVRIEAAAAQRDEMARPLDRLNAVAVLPSAARASVTLGWLRSGTWQGFTNLDFDAAPADTDNPRTASLDMRLRETAAALPRHSVEPVERLEQLAVLARWFYSSWRDGELLLFDDWDKPPYRKIVNAVSRVARAAAKPTSPPDAPRASGTAESTTG